MRSKRYYPIFLDLQGRTCVVVGGGRVAERKVRALLRAGARVHVISPNVTPRLATLAAKKKIALTPRAYRRGDLQVGARGSSALAGPERSRREGLASARAGRPWLVFAATDDPAAQEAVRKDAEATGTLVNLANGATRSAFLVPASFRQGDLHVAISTSGASPAFARALRRQLQRIMGREYRAYLQVLRSARRKVLKTVPMQPQRTRILRRLATELTDLTCTKDKSKIKRQKAKIKNGKATHMEIFAF